MRDRDVSKQVSTPINTMHFMQSKLWVEVYASIAVVLQDECESNICQNGGSCRTLAGDYICLCPPSHTGLQCQQRKSVVSRLCMPSRLLIAWNNTHEGRLDALLPLDMYSCKYHVTFLAFSNLTTLYYLPLVVPLVLECTRQLREELLVIDCTANKPLSSISCLHNGSTVDACKRELLRMLYNIVWP